MGSLKTKNSSGKPIVICICGMAGSGKSTLAKRVAQEYGLRYFSGGDALMALAVEEGYKPLERGWWESNEGLRFLEKRRKDPRFDKAIDEKLLKTAEKGNVVLDSWTMPWLFNNGFKIWLEASPEKRAERIAIRDRMDYYEALEALKKKESQTKKIYKKMYGFNLGDDLEPFNFILDTDTLGVDEVFHVLCLIIKSEIF
jgi:cytidylate kinase